MDAHRCPHGKPCPPVLPGEACEECEAHAAAKAAARERDLTRLRAIARLYDEAAFDASDVYYGGAHGTPAQARALVSLSEWRGAADALRQAHGTAKGRRVLYHASLSDFVKHEFWTSGMDDAWHAAVSADVRRRLDEGYDGPLPQPVVEYCADTFALPGSAVMHCVLPIGHAGAHALEALPPNVEAPRASEEA